MRTVAEADKEEEQPKECECSNSILKEQEEEKNRAAKKEGKSLQRLPVGGSVEMAILHPRNKLEDGSPGQVKSEE
ncbi:hypothetical protein SAY86_021802 [Trapa natans]|uniref:Uncharacterized protein n=1 Tax=Trapa natans TaxID=22666 RepID=A0AAN7M8M5_TRANT|nr:hypothetical protein SAY86_021802 [Trapa natans]